MSPTEMGLARPRVAFITWPTRKVSACSLPALKSTTACLFDAITSLTAASTAALSSIRVRPRRAAVSRAAPPVRNISSKTFLAAGPVTAPSSIMSTSSTRRAGVTRDSPISMPAEFSQRASSPRTQLLTVLAFRWSAPPSTGATQASK